MKPAPARRPNHRQRAIKVAVFATCLAPLVWLAWAGLNGGLGANPVEAVIRSLGDWTVRMLLVALAVTPLRLITSWSWVGPLRRMLGLFAFAYASLHLLAYIGLDQFFDTAAILGEIAKRRFILIGMGAFLILLALASTSTDALRRRLGGARWRRLHSLVYVAGVLAVIHYLMAVKLDIGPPLLHGAVLGVLLGVRVAWAWARRGPVARFKDAFGARERRPEPDRLAS